jgi:hypothetical protein
MKHIQIMNWCIFKYGITKSRAVPCVLYDPDLKHDGWYNFARDTIFLRIGLSTTELIKTVIHEYQHYLKHSVKEFEKHYNLGHTYADHPFEIEAEEIALRDLDECLLNLNE